MNERTVVAVCCYQGDMQQVIHALPLYAHHNCPVVVFSPKDSPVLIPGVRCLQFGRRAYIGQDSLDRQRFYMQSLLNDSTAQYFLLNDSDSFCVSAQIPVQAYAESADTIWAGIISESRPHISPYPKLALHPPYFFDRPSLGKMLSVAGEITAHPITPYVDWYMLALACEAGLTPRAWAELEHDPKDGLVFSSDDTPEIRCWQELDYRIRYKGTRMLHPIKTPEQVRLCVEARKFYER